MKRSALRLAVLTLTVAVAASACSELETRVTRPNDGEPRFDVFLQVPSGQTGGNVIPAPSPNVQLTDDQGNVLNITQGQVAVREMELGRESGECVDSTDGTEDDGDACVEITVPPQLLTLPVDRREVQIVNQIPVVDGSYDRLEFDLHVVTEDDQGLVGTNPQFLGASILIRGSFNGSSFAVTLNPEDELTLDFPQAVQTEAGATSRITLVAEMAGWFRAEDGSLIDPTQLEEGSAQETRVKEQISNAFSVQLGPPQ